MIENVFGGDHLMLDDPREAFEQAVVLAQPRAQAPVRHLPIQQSRRLCSQLGGAVVVAVAHEFVIVSTAHALDMNKGNQRTCEPTTARSNSALLFFFEHRLHDHP